MRKAILLTLLAGFVAGWMAGCGSSPGEPTDAHKSTQRNAAARNSAVGFGIGLSMKSSRRIVAGSRQAFSQSW